MKLKGKVYKTLVRQAVLYSAETWTTTRGQEMNTLEGQEKWRKAQASKKMTQNESSGM